MSRNNKILLIAASLFLLAGFIYYKSANKNESLGLSSNNNNDDSGLAGEKEFNYLLKKGIDAEGRTGRTNYFYDLANSDKKIKDKGLQKFLYNKVSMEEVKAIAKFMDAFAVGVGEETAITMLTSEERDLVDNAINKIK